YNLVEVGSYDTSPLDSSGFNGAWGATPTLPSGLILVSDIEGGLFVFRPTFTRAAYLEGTVRDGMTGDTLPDASVKIFVFDSTTSMTDMYGEYSMGIVDQNTVPNPPADTNTVLVRASREGYSSKDSFITFVPGSIVTVDFDLLQAIVPVELISFNVEDEDCSNMLKWVVGSEINHSHFEVQTSRDGVTFTSIVKIFPNEKNSNVYHYQHEVVDPVRVYYRLLQMDLDGTTALSRVVQSTSKCEDSGVHIAPNPVRNNLEIKSSFLIEEISLYHPAGARLFHEKVNQPSLVQSLDLSGLPAGVYTLMLRQEGKVTSRKIVKIN
ncbi:MAG: T9SS type A sorting domain-containing protein, partial [Saprospiraceae bacterium]|nr:T9SS type A sorting domain-containing protein [Saprospiraceae bacterium]